ncbi:MAG: hypothetical protein KGL39_56150 [Patescibacteria group bacterium]|nr:hypothetical protein [Patescibacteria group bacterium]
MSLFDIFGIIALVLQIFGAICALGVLGIAVLFFSTVLDEIREAKINTMENEQHDRDS